MGIGLKLCHSIGHRYVLVGMCSSGLALTTLNRLLFSMILKEIIYRQRMGSDDQSDCPSSNFEDYHSPGVEEFLWGRQLQLLIMGGFMMGFAMGRLPAGLATDKLGAKTLFGFSIFIPGICSLLIPLCARTSPYVVLVNQLIMGMTASVQDPCLAWLAVRWFPIGQLGFMLSIMFSGFPLGMALRFYASLQMFKYYWTAIFYVSGLLSILHAYFWQAIVWDDPFEHPYISMRELELLVDQVPMYALDSELEPGWSWPWKEMLTSRSVWTLNLAYFGYCWCLFFAFLILPTLYFPKVHGYHFMQHHNVGLGMCFLVIIALLVAGAASDRLVQSKMFSNTHVTKAYYSIGTILSSLLFIGLAHSECARTTVFIYYTGAVLCLGVGYTAFALAVVAVAPNFAGTLVSLTTFLGVASVPLQLKLQRSMTTESTLKNWQTVTYMNGAIAIFSTAIFLKCGRCLLRPWNQPKPKSDKDKMASESVDYGDEDNRKQLGLSVEPTTPESEDVTPQLSEHAMTLGPTATRSQQKLAQILSKKTPRPVSSSTTLDSVPRQKSVAGVHWRELLQNQLRQEEEERQSQLRQEQEHEETNRPLESKPNTPLGSTKSQIGTIQSNQKSNSSKWF